MWLRQWAPKIGVTILLGLTPDFILWFIPKSHTQDIFNWRRVLRTHLLVCFLFWMKSSLAWNTIFWSYFMFIKVTNYLAPNFTTEDFMIHVSGPLANYVHGCHATQAMRTTLGYISYQQGIIQGHLVHRYAPRKATILCSRVVFWAVLSPDVSTQTVFLYYMSVKYTLKRYFWCFGVHVTHLLLSQTDEINTIFEPFIGCIYGGTGEF